MKSLKLFLVFFVVLVCLVSTVFANVEIEKGVLFQPTNIGSPFNATIDFTANSIEVGEDCVNISGGTLAGFYCNQSIGNCSTYANNTITFKIYKENYISESLNATMEMEGNLWQGNSLFYNPMYPNFSFSFPYYNTHELCLWNNQSTQVNIYLQHTANNGFTHRYYMYNETLTANNQTINLYNWNDTTGASDLKITLRDEDTYQYKQNILAKLQRRYLSEGVWRTVQMDQSGDFGLIHFNIREADTDYRILYLNTNNELYETSKSLKFVCESYVCELTKTLGDISTDGSNQNLSISIDYNNETNIITVNWFDSLGGTDTVRFKVVKETVTGTAYICNTTQSGSSGTIKCNATGYSGLVQAYVYTTASPEVPKLSQLIDLAKVSLSGLIGATEGSIWAFGITLTILGFGVAIGTTSALISLMFGLLLVYFLGIFTPLTATVLISSFILSIIIGAYLKK